MSMNSDKPFRPIPKDILDAMSEPKDILEAVGELKDSNDWDDYLPPFLRGTSKDMLGINSEQRIQIADLLNQITTTKKDSAPGESKIAVTRVDHVMYEHMKKYAIDHPGNKKIRFATEEEKQNSDAQDVSEEYPLLYSKDYNSLIQAIVPKRKTFPLFPTHFQDPIDIVPHDLDDADSELMKLIMERTKSMCKKPASISLTTPSGQESLLSQILKDEQRPSRTYEVDFVSMGSMTQSDPELTFIQKDHRIINALPFQSDELENTKKAVETLFEERLQAEWDKIYSDIPPYIPNPQDIIKKLPSGFGIVPQQRERMHFPHISLTHHEDYPKEVGETVKAWAEMAYCPRLPQRFPTLKGQDDEQCKNLQKDIPKVTDILDEWRENIHKPPKLIDPPLQKFPPPPPKNVKKKKDNRTKMVKQSQRRNRKK